MKILLLSEFFPEVFGGEISGGVEARTYFVSQELAKMGHQVEVVTSKTFNVTEKSRWGSLAITRIGPTRKYTSYGSIIDRLYFHLAVARYLRGKRVDIVDSNNGNVYLGSFLGTWLTGQKLVYWVPDVVGFKGWIKAAGIVRGLMAYPLDTLIGFLRPQNYIALSNYTREKIVDLGVPSNLVKVVYPGVSQIKKPKILPKRPILISVNRLLPSKRTELAIQAISILKHKGIDLDYQIIGEGPEKKKLARLVQKLGLALKVKFFVNLRHPQVIAKMSQASIFTLPSDIEGFGIATLEGMSQGLPYVNSNISVNREITRLSGAGLLFRQGDAADLADKILGLIKNKTLYQKLSLDAITFAKKHPWHLVARETEKVYENLLSH